MFVALNEIVTAHPNLKVIVGIDANHFLSEQKGFDIVPRSPDVATSIKKRSFLQAQYKKSGLLVSEVKDHIITNQKIREFSI